MKTGTVICFILLNLVFAAVAHAETRLLNTRTGNHETFTRIVLDSEGDHPLSIEHDPGNVVDISYENLVLTEGDINRLKQQLDKISDIVIYKKDNKSHLKLVSGSGDIKLKTAYLPAVEGGDNGYRLVIDLYPAPDGISSENSSRARLSIEDKMENISESGILPDKDTTESTGIISGGMSVQAVSAGSVESADNSSSQAGLGKKSTPEPVIPESNTGKQPPVKEKTVESSGTPDATRAEISGKAEIILRNTSNKKESSKFDEYSDRTQPVTGSIEINRTSENRSEIDLKMKDIGQEDQNAVLKGEIYGTVRVKTEYDELPHRYQYGARTLYSGIGTGDLTLDDTIQSTMESTPYPGIDNQLSTYMESAATGDPMVTRKKGYLNIEWIKFAPFKLNLELKKEKRDGTIPRFGSLGFGNTVELLEPVEYDSTQIRLSSEYKTESFLLNASYYFSSFKNDNKFLSWDNPLTLNDYLYNSSRGMMGLAPDNKYHNISMSGYVSNLPYYTRISANVAFGWMSQDDILAPYTVNTAVTAPDVPVGGIDGEVKTRSLNLLVTSNPFNSMNLKLKLRSYEHKNNTTPVIFPGFVDTDDFFNPTPVINIPSSYKKDTIDAGLRKDLFKDLRLSLDYTWNKMERTAREVSKQDDRGFKLSIDSTFISWLYLRASYERTNRDVENYIYDIYLDEGEDLMQNPLLRKYDEADMKRDRIQFHADITPWDKLGFSLSYIYGKDDFEKSTYGLLEDRHSIITFDADYALSENSSLHAFYSNERYKNITAGNGFAGIEVADWIVNGSDRVNTFGGSLKTRLFIENLDLDLSYSYSKADGNLGFVANGTDFSQLTNVDDSSFRILKGELSYRAGSRWVCTLGYLWEKAVYSDFNKEGFTYVPSDGSALGFYQGALLMGILPQDYDINQVYLKVSHFF